MGLCDEADVEDVQEPSGAVQQAAEVHGSHGEWRPWITDWPEHLARLERTAESHDRCTPTELANWNKVSRQTVYNWRDRWLLVYDADKKIDVPATVALWRFLSKLR